MEIAELRSKLSSKNYYPILKKLHDGSLEQSLASYAEEHIHSQSSEEVEKSIRGTLQSSGGVHCNQLKSLFKSLNYPLASHYFTIFMMENLLDFYRALGNPSNMVFLDRLPHKDFTLLKKALDAKRSWVEDPTDKKKKHLSNTQRLLRHRREKIEPTFNRRNARDTSFFLEMFIQACSPVPENAVDRTFYIYISILEDDTFYRNTVFPSGLISHYDFPKIRECSEPFEFFISLAAAYQK